MWRAISSFIWGSAGQDLATDEDLKAAYSILEETTARETAEEVADYENLPECEKADAVVSPDYACVHKQGTITDVEEDTYLIDNVHTYPIRQAPDLCIGTTVAYTLLRERTRTVVTNVTVVNTEDWCFQEATGGGTTAVLAKERGWCNRTQMCQITKREGRVLTANPRGLVIDLNAVSAEFVPIVGDWVELDLKCEIDESVSDLCGKVLEIEKIRAVRPNIVEGVINLWDPKTLTGTINHDIFFNKDCLSSGYIPTRGDRIVTEVIESTQGRCVWRSLKLIVNELIQNTTLEIALEKNFPKIIKHLPNLPDVIITDHLSTTSDNFNKAKQFPIKIQNKGNSPITLEYLKNHSNQPQVLISQSNRAINNLVIGSDSTCYLSANYRPRMIGHSQELITFHFGSLGVVGRYIDVTLEVVSQSYVGVPGHYRKPQNSVSMGNMSQNRDVIRGQRPVEPPRFMAAKLPEFAVPRMLEKIILDGVSVEGLEGAGSRLRLNSTCAEIVKWQTSLGEPLSFRNYDRNFHAMLHLEDIENMRAMRNYDQDRACFIRNGEFLTLEIANLHEQRPSIMIGDKVVARDVFKEDGGIILEGYVHQMGAHHIHLKFGPLFHDKYDGEDYSITVFHSRSQIRKMHQAVHMATAHLGERFLFPTKVEQSNPQVQFTYDPYNDDDFKNIFGNDDNKIIDNGNIENDKQIDDLQISNGCETDCMTSIGSADLSSNQNGVNSLNSSSDNLGQSGDITEINTSSDRDLSMDSISGNGSNKLDSQLSENKTNIDPAKKRLTPQQKIFAKLRERKMNKIEQSSEERSRKTEEPKTVISKINVKLDNDHKAKIRDISGKKYHLEWYNKQLNFYQKEAVRNILLGQARPSPYFIFGPPGTGKTVTIIETILQLIRLLPHSRLLVAAPSNSAADLIALRLISSGALRPGDMVRFVSYRAVVEDLIPAALVPYSATGSYARPGTGTGEVVVLPSGVTLGCSSEVIGRHRVTVATCGALGAFYSMGFPKGHFTHVIVDEAGQATEPECIVPLVHINAKQGQAILAGDPMQLGPVVMSKEASEFGLKESFLDRLLSRFPYARDPTGFPDTSGYDPRLVTRLVYNYRALPELLELPNQLFYDSELRPTISSVDSHEANLLRKLTEMLPKRAANSDHPTPPSIVFHGINSENFQTDDSPSWFNPDEASQVFYYVNELYRLGVKAEQLGVISPYIKQVKQIRCILQEAEFDMPKVGSVEEFQGQEFDVILLSTVRSNSSFIDSDIKHTIGFLSNPRRLNVAITRAKSLIIIIGNPKLLSMDLHWRAVLTYCVSKGAYFGCALPSNITVS